MANYPVAPGVTGFQTIIEGDDDATLVGLDSYQGAVFIKIRKAFRPWKDKKAGVREDYWQPTKQGLQIPFTEALEVGKAVVNHSLDQEAIVNALLKK